MGFLMALCTMNGQAGLQTKAHIKRHTHTLTHTNIKDTHKSNSSFQPHDRRHLHTQPSKCTNISTADKRHSRWNYNRNVCAHINRNNTCFQRTDTDERRCVCVWERDKGHAVKWVRSNPRMEKTKNTSAHVRRVKEDTSWHLMPENKITLCFFLCKQILAFLNIAYQYHQV